MVTCNIRDKFLLAKSTKKLLKRVNFTNLKTPGDYIAKSKSQGVCLQLSQTPKDDYVIWPKKKNRMNIWREMGGERRGEKRRMLMKCTSVYIFCIIFCL